MSSPNSPKKSLKEALIDWAKIGAIVLVTTWVYAGELLKLLKKWAWTPTHKKGYNKSIAIVKIGTAYGVAQIIWHDLVLIPSFTEIMTSFTENKEAVEHAYQNIDQLQPTAEERLEGLSWDLLYQVPYKLWEWFLDMSLHDKAVTYIEISVFWNITSLWSNFIAWRNRSCVTLLARMGKDEKFKSRFLASKKRFAKMKQDKIKEWGKKDKP